MGMSTSGYRRAEGVVPTHGPKGEHWSGGGGRQASPQLSTCATRTPTDPEMDWQPHGLLPRLFSLRTVDNLSG